MKPKQGYIYKKSIGQLYFIYNRCKISVINAILQYSLFLTILYKVYVSNKIITHKNPVEIIFQ